MPHVQNQTARGRGFVAVLEDDQAPSGKVTKSFDREAQARKWIKKMVALQEAGTYVTPERGKVPFGDRYATYADTRATVLSRNSQNTEEDFMRCYVLPRFEKVALGDIDHDMVTKWVADLVANRYAPATVQKAFRVLDGMLDDAVRAHCIGANPCKSVKTPTVSRSKVRPIAPADLAKLAAALPTPADRLWMKASATGGFRAEESFALRKRHIDQVRPTVTVCETIVEVQSTLVEGATKTLSSDRVVKMPPSIWRELVAFAEPLEPNDLLFPAPAGGAMRLRNFRKRVWYPATVKSGLGRFEPCLRKQGEACTRCKGDGTKPTLSDHYVGATIHGLRHTAISMWLRNGTALLEVSKRAGHSKVAFTLDRYGHLLDEDDDTMDAFDATTQAMFG